METKLQASKEKIDFLSTKAYHYLEAHGLNENTLDQIVVKFKLTPSETLRHTRKIDRIKRRYFINNKILARSIIKCRYNVVKIITAKFDENSPLAIFLNRK